LPGAHGTDAPGRRRFPDFTQLCWRHDLPFRVTLREPPSAMYEVDQSQDAYREGLFARALGRSCHGNPYPEHSREALLWIHGWWLIQDAGEIAPADEFEHGSPSFPNYFIYTEAPSTFLDERADPPILSALNQTVEVVRLAVTGFLLAAAGFSLSYWLLRVVLL